MTSFLSMKAYYASLAWAAPQAAPFVFGSRKLAEYVFTGFSDIVNSTANIIVIICITCGRLVLSILSDIYRSIADIIIYTSLATI